MKEVDQKQSDYMDQLTKISNKENSVREKVKGMIEEKAIKETELQNLTEICESKVMNYIFRVKVFFIIHYNT